ncbi:Spt20 family-domain-containing protein [Cristinia sonorae]|uniref:Spt20 family-domain-containing protein n=1 Tax=Cristinia sonorae TaxID=1940300 RepID=A0A8K0UUW0_9AGAR|nr:Spt20 family-domain-containing protein [Cristinia sonorae]
MAGYNLTRSVDELLETNRTAPPSFTVHLYPEHWTLNSGLKFLYNNQVASLLDDIRAQRIPNDFLELFDSARVPFYDGHMIVELLDYRPPKGKDPILENPEKRRVVLSPNAETMWTDLCLLNQKAGNVWTDQDALEVEAQILMSTAPPLCLDPDPHLTRMVNGVLRVTVPPAPPALKRKAAAMEMEEDEMDRARRAKIMQYMNPKPHRSSAPRYALLEALTNPI